MTKKKKRKRKRKSNTDADQSETTTRSSTSQSTASSQTVNRTPLTQNAPIGNASAVPEPIDANASAVPEPIDGAGPLSADPAYQPRSAHHIQRALEGTDTTQDEVPEPVLDVLSNGGQPLEASLQRALEERMDADFSDVRIHTGGAAAKAAEAIDAKAFTCGNDIVFNAGEYDPDSPEGQHLLAHELAHVTQQNGGAPISMMPKESADLEIDPDPHLEREADETAAQALSGEEPLVINRMGTDVHIQRSQATDSIASPSELRTLVADHVDKKLEEHGLTGLADQVEQNTEAIDDLTVDGDDLEELEAALDGEDLDESVWDQVSEVGPEAMNPFTEKGASNHLEGLVAAGLSGGAALATGGAALLPAAAAMMAPSIRNTASDAVVGDGVNLSPEEISAIAQQVEELRAQEDTSSDNDDPTGLRGDD